MEITNSVALVSAANRGLGKAYVEALLAAGAAKVYAGARDPTSITDPRLIPVKLDVTSSDDVEQAAKTCTDVSLLINNAGVLLANEALTAGPEVALCHEMAVNVFGVVRMTRAFAPVLARNGGGAIANVVSVVNWFVNPVKPRHCASKHAVLAAIDALRTELQGQSTHVVAVYAGYIDTNMTATITCPKTSAHQVAEQTLDGVRGLSNHVLADMRAKELWKALKRDVDPQT